MKNFLFLLLVNVGFAMPKAELHLHLGGAYPLSYLESIATPEQKMALEVGLQKIAMGLPYSECFAIFPLINQIVNTDEKVEKGVAALCQEMEKDDIVYAEIRTGLKDLGNGYENNLQALLRGMTKNTRLILSLKRSSSLDFAKQTVDLALKYRDKGIVGIDLSGDSTIGESTTILPELIRAKQEGLFLTLHIGESPLEKDQLILLQTLQPERIGHGVHLQKEALQWILDRKIPIEVCLTSSKLVQMVPHNQEHPGLTYFRQGHPIVICTDDPLIFSITLSHEYELLHPLFSKEQVEELAKNSLYYAFLSKEEKESLK